MLAEKTRLPFHGQQRLEKAQAVAQAAIRRGKREVRLLNEFPVAPDNAHAATKDGEGAAGKNRQQTAARKKKKRPDRLSPGKTQKPKGTFSRAALSCDGGKETCEGMPVKRFFEENGKKIVAADCIRHLEFGL